MNTETHRFKHGEITQKVIGVFFDVFNELGHGFLESVYEKSLELQATDQHGCTRISTLKYVSRSTPVFLAMLLIG